MAQAVDLICLSDVPWDAAPQRLRALLEALRASRRVFFVERPVETRGPGRLEVRGTPGQIQVVTPHLAAAMHGPATAAVEERLLRGLVRRTGLATYALWYASPSALDFTSQLRPALVIHDEATTDAQTVGDGLGERRAALLALADVILCGKGATDPALAAMGARVRVLPSDDDLAAEWLSGLLDGAAGPRAEAGLGAMTM